MDHRKLVDDLSFCDENQIVTFTFKQPDNTIKKIRCLKSFLSDISPVMRNDFETEVRGENVVEMDDKVNFDQYEHFKVFIRTLLYLETATASIPMTKLSDGVESEALISLLTGYFYAEKYQIHQQYKDIYIGLLLSLKQTFSIDDLEACLELVELFSLSDIKRHLDSINLKISLKVAVRAYELCNKHGLDKQIEKILAFLEDKDISESWPMDLTTRVWNRNRAKIEDSALQLNEHKKILESMLVEGDDVVTFVFSGKSRIIRCSKSKLLEISPILKKELENVRQIEINYGLPWDESIHFLSFVKVLYGMKKISDLYTAGCCSHYMYCKKLGISKYLEQIIVRITSIDHVPITNPSYFSECLRIAEDHGYPELIDALNYANFDFNDDNVREITDIAVDKKMYVLMYRISKYVEMKTVEDWWPKDLMKLVLGNIQLQLSSKKSEIKEQ